MSRLAAILNKTKTIRPYYFRIIGYMVLVLLFLVQMVNPVWAQGPDYELNWWTIDNGGSNGGQGNNKTLSGGNYDLFSTIGQADVDTANFGYLIGGDYELATGYWPDIVLDDLVYLPAIIKSPAPDLIGSFTVNPANPAAGAPAVVTVIVTNQGNVAASAFWVDFYINPTTTPTVNQRWNDICQSVCKGIAWYISGGLGAGQSTTLTSNSFPGNYSDWAGSFPAGSSNLYLLVDSWNPGVAAGGVQESNESNNLFNAPISVSGSAVSSASSDPPAVAPRPAP